MSSAGFIPVNPLSAPGLLGCDKNAFPPVVSGREALCKHSEGVEEGVARNSNL